MSMKWLSKFMLNEYDVVRLKRSSPAVPLPPGTKGAVVHVYPADPPGYEVEFVDEAGKTLGVYTVPGADLEL